MPQEFQDTARALNADPLQWLLAGGEDHALAATFPPDVDLPMAWSVVGRVEAGEGVLVDGAAWPGPGGWRSLLACRPSSSPPSGCPGRRRTPRGSTPGCSRTSTRRRTGEKHPVEDFLFDYYHLSPAKLRRWHPGAGVVLAGPEARPYLELADYRQVAGGVTVDRDRLARHGRRLRDVRRLLVATASRPASYGCFGLHEWAMVYRQPADEVRHAGHPLRLGSAGTDTVVEAGPLRCTHIDAYRFFTPEAAPLNALRPDPGHPGRARAAGLPARRDGPLQVGGGLRPVPAVRADGRLLRARPRDPRASTCAPRRTTWPTSATRRSRWRPRTAGPSTSAASAASPSGAVLRTRLVAALDALAAHLPSTTGAPRRVIMRDGVTMHDHGGQRGRRRRPAPAGGPAVGCVEVRSSG